MNRNYKNFRDKAAKKYACEPGEDWEHTPGATAAFRAGADMSQEYYIKLLTPLVHALQAIEICNGYDPDHLGEDYAASVKITKELQKTAAKALTVYRKAIVGAK
jgi:hypothetical protein